MKKFFVFTILFLVTPGANAAVTFSVIFGSNMVLQRNVPLPVWGKASPGEKITVEFLEKKYSVKTKKDSTWSTTLAAAKEGGPYKLTVTGADTIVLSNIMVGEVWICSGQSNMEFALYRGKDGQEEVKKANHENIRLFTVKRKSEETPQFSAIVKPWAECTSSSADSFSAVAYFFGRALYDSLKIPIGLIHSSWGGTAAESWISRSAPAAHASYDSLLKNWNKSILQYPDKLKKFEKDLPALTARWKEDSVKAKAEGRPVPRKPEPPAGPGHQRSPGGLYNGMISPLIPYAIRGVIWYQGEANSGRAYKYRTLFPAMINDWRAKWNAGEFPFLFVQLANFTRGGDSTRGWAELRESQMMTLKAPNTGMAVTIDIGEPHDIHPKNKQDVGYRLALWALAKTYGKNSIVYSGPLYESFRKVNSDIIVFFRHAGNGLIIKGDVLKGFEIAGEDRIFHPAAAAIAGNTVVVSAPGVDEPAAVRYAFKDDPECNLFNSNGLPASPFRTDDWEEFTRYK